MDSAAPDTAWLTLPRWVYRHRTHSGYFEDQLTGRPGHREERHRRQAARFAALGLPYKMPTRPHYLTVVERRWTAAFGSSTPEDAFRATGTDPQEPDTEERRSLALHRMSDGLARSWSTSPRVREAIADLASDSRGTWVDAKREAGAVGLCLALGRMDVPQRVRFGNHYVVSLIDWRPVDIAPVLELAAVPFVRWLRRQAITEAEAHLLGEPTRDAPASEPRDYVPIDDVLLLEDVSAGPLDDVILDRVAVDAVLAAADLTPAELALAEAFRETGEWPEAARLLDLAMPTMRQRKRRLLAKLTPP